METEIPFVINNEYVPHIAAKVFAYTDIKTLLICRFVSKSWKHHIDRKTLLWSKMSLAKAIKNDRLDVGHLIMENAK